MLLFPNTYRPKHRVNGSSFNRRANSSDQEHSMSSGGHRDLSTLMDISKLLSEESNNNDGLEKELESSTVLTVKAEITPQVRDLTSPRDY